VRLDVSKKKKTDKDKGTVPKTRRSVDRQAPFGKPSGEAARYKYRACYPTDFQTFCLSPEGQYEALLPKGERSEPCPFGEAKAASEASKFGVLRFFQKGKVYNRNLNESFGNVQSKNKIDRKSFKKSQHPASPVSIKSVDIPVSRSFPRFKKETR